MAWRIIEVPDNESENDLSDAELIGIKITMQSYMGEPFEDTSVYYRAWRKLLKSAEKAFENAQGE